MLCLLGIMQALQVAKDLCVQAFFGRKQEEVEKQFSKLFSVLPEALFKIGNILRFLRILRNLHTILHFA